MAYANVRDKKTQIERTITAKNYSILGEKRYQLLGWVDEEGNEVDGPNAPTKSVRTTQKKSAEPVQAKIEVREMKPKLTREDLDAMNQSAMDKATEAAENDGKLPMNHPDVIAQIKRNKPGPKPKQHA